MLWLANELWIGTRFAHDLPAARQWFEKAAACGRREPLANLGKMLNDLPANEEERQRGIKLMRQAAVRGSVLAQHYLSPLFLLGEGGASANPKVGYLLAASAVDRGQNDAWAGLALAFEKGLGVAKDVKAARKCLETGAGRGSAYSA